MRVTTKMINNSMMNQMSTNKNKMFGLEEQYNSGKKIQRPSDDPIIAVRSLKLRSTISEVNQYLENNIPDARSWMEITESSLKNMNSIFTKAYADMEHGANDTLTTSDRKSILENLKQYKEQIYHEGNVDNAGRYVFTGYKTNNGLLFDRVENELDYEITQTFGRDNMERIQRLTGTYNVTDYDSNNPDADAFKKPPEMVSDLYRIQLGYKNIKDGSITADSITYTTTDADGNKVSKPVSTLGFTVTNIEPGDQDIYKVQDNEIRIDSQTGEVLFGKNVYDALRLQEDGEIGITYGKNSFESGNVKPEHYYDCKVTNKYGEVTDYKHTPQDIYYEINFGQKIQVNVNMENVIGNEFARKIDDLEEIIEKVGNIEKDIEEIERKLKDAGINEDQKRTLNALKSQKEIELSLENGNMTETFEKGMYYIKEYQAQINVSVANLGSRMNRLDLVEDRLDSQKNNYTELLSKTEDANIVETYINLSSAENIYNASLQVSTKIAKTSLLDYL